MTTGWGRWLSKLLGDIQSTWYTAKWHWRDARMENWCLKCEHRYSEACPYLFVKTNTLANVMVCEKFKNAKPKASGKKAVFITHNLQDGSFTIEDAEGDKP